MRQRMKKAGQAFLLLFAVLFMVSAGAFLKAEEVKAAAMPEAPLGMEVSYGFNDTAKGDRYLKVTVLLSNQEAEDFSGTVRILTTESSLEVYRYDYPVAVNGQGQCSVDYYIPLGIKSDQMFVSIWDEEGTEVLRKRLKLNISRDVSECFVGVFSDVPERLQYMDEVGIHYGSIKTQLIMLDADTAPEEELGYDQLDLIVVSDYDLNRISEKQHQALSRWVDKGGTLLVGGGLRYRENLGRFASELLEPPYTWAKESEVNLGMEYAQNAPQDSVLSLMCADVNLKNGSTLIQGEGFPFLSYVHQKNGRIAVAAFSLGDISEFCESRPAFLEKLLTKTFGETKVNELSQMEFYGFSNLYFLVQGLINTGDAERLPNVILYTAVIIIYLLLIGPGIYLYLKKREIHRYYMAGVALCAVLFTGIIYVMGVGTRFREPFFTYATILDTSGDGVEEETYINIRSPYNKPYAVNINPEYTIRPVTKSYYYDSMMRQRFTGEETYKTCLQFLPERTEIRVRDTVAFTPKLFYLSRQVGQAGTMEIEGSAGLFSGEVSGTIVNRFDETLESAALIFYGKAICLGDLEPGQEVDLSQLPVYNYPLGHTYALAQRITGADQYEKTDISDEAYMKAQERSRLLGFYLDSNLNSYFADARLVAFTKEQREQGFLADETSVAEGLTMITSELELNREKNGLLCRMALEQEPNVISGNYMTSYNSMYIGEPSDPVIIEYSLGSDLQIQKLCFEEVSPEFFDPDYPYLTAFQGEMYFYNYDTGHNDRMEMKKSFTARELEPYLSPSNTLTVKYVSTGSGEYGWESCLPMIYAVGEVK